MVNVCQLTCQYKLLCFIKKNVQLYPIEYYHQKLEGQENERNKFCFMFCWSKESISVCSIWNDPLLDCSIFGVWKHQIILLKTTCWENILKFWGPKVDPLWYPSLWMEHNLLLGTAYCCLLWQWITHIDILSYNLLSNFVSVWLRFCSIVLCRSGEFTNE